MKKKYIYIFLIIIFYASIVSCTTPYSYQTNSFEHAIVVEATLTNELKKQEIKLSRTYKFEEDGPIFETEADVYITDNLENQYSFEEVDQKYISTSEFQALPDRTYQLHIITKDGRSYSSTNEKLTTVNEIETITPVVTKKGADLGVEITVNSFDPTNTSKYYRYEYEETYKIIAPKWVSTEAIARFFPPGTGVDGDLTLKQRETEAKTCFSTKKSDHTILTNTNNLSEDRVNFPLRFISSSDYIIMNRYSIFVKQYVQNFAAHTFYQTLKDISGSESILSQTQPGFFAGNIKSDDNPNEKVIGFFDVSSVSNKRIFFNFSDLFPAEPTPKYPYNCPDITADNEREYVFQYCFWPPTDRTCLGYEILDNLIKRNSAYYDGWRLLGVVPSDGSVYIQMYPIQCGDCTSFSSNIKPTFWID
jgi:hypothetical protein